MILPSFVYCRREFGLERFVPGSLLEGMKRKELRRLIGHFLKLNQQMTGSSKMLTQLQVNMSRTPSICTHICPVRKFSFEQMQPAPAFVGPVQKAWHQRACLRYEFGETQHKYTCSCQTSLIASSENQRLMLYSRWNCLYASCRVANRCLPRFRDRRRKGTVCLWLNVNIYGESSENISNPVFFSLRIQFTRSDIAQ